MSGLPCDARCVWASTPAQACTCSRCLGVHHGSQPRPATVLQMALFDECGADVCAEPTDARQCEPSPLAVADLLPPAPAGGRASGVGSGPSFDPTGPAEGLRGSAPEVAGSTLGSASPHGDDLLPAAASTGPVSGPVPAGPSPRQQTCSAGLVTEINQRAAVAVAARLAAAQPEELCGRCGRWLHRYGYSTCARCAG